MFGGAIATEEGTDAITSSTISDCTAGAGGAIYSEDGSVTLEGSSTVTGCSAINGGAIATEEGTDTITSSTISDCTATEFGGAIVTELGSVTITSSKIAGSSGNRGRRCDWTYRQRHHQFFDDHRMLGRVDWWRYMV